MFGWLRAVRGDLTVTKFESYKTSCLLAYLALNSDTSHPREVLAEMLWPEGERRVILSRLSQALSSLRRQLEPTHDLTGAVFHADSRTLRLNPEACITDVWEFRTCLEEADRAGSAKERVSSLTTACALYRGPLTPAVFEEWALMERECLELLYFGSVAELRDIYGLQGNRARSDELAVRLRSSALESQEQQIISNESAFSASAPWLDANSPPPFLMGPSNLPTPHTSFVGRQEELVQIERALTQQKHRIVTLVGAGGCGKM